MGYAKYSEDIERKRTEGIYEREVNYPSAPSKIYFDCYYCDKSFESFEDRNNHIKSSHNVAGPLLFVNGKIASDENYVESIETAKIVLCGFNDVAIYVDNHKIKNDNTDIDLISHFKKEANRHIIKIEQKQISIYKYESINISSKENDEIINGWEKQTENLQPLNPSHGGYPTILNQAEKQYLNGFFEYYTACKTTDSTHKKNRYEAAFAILSSFNKLTPKARVLLKVIAFRFNWIETLVHHSKATQEQGLFDIIIDFYYGRASAITEEEGTRKKQQQIFVEDDIEECLNAILAYQNKKYDLVDTFLAKWRDDIIVHIEDTNKKDRILFLKARRNDKKYFEAVRTPLLKKIAKEI